jgi:hypothetical protein
MVRDAARGGGRSRQWLQGEGFVWQGSRHAKCRGSLKARDRAADGALTRVASRKGDILWRPGGHAPAQEVRPLPCASAEHGRGGSRRRVVAGRRRPAGGRAAAVGGGAGGAGVQACRQVEAHGHIPRGLAFRDIGGLRSAENLWLAGRDEQVRSNGGVAWCWWGCRGGRRDGRGGVSGWVGRQVPVPTRWDCQGCFAHAEDKILAQGLTSRRGSVAEAGREAKRGVHGAQSRRCAAVKGRRGAVAAVGPRHQHARRRRRDVCGEDARRQHRDVEAGRRRPASGAAHAQAEGRRRDGQGGRKNEEKPAVGSPRAAWVVGQAWSQMVRDGGGRA